MAAWPTPREWPRVVGSSMPPKTRQSLFKFKHSKHHHTLLNGFDNETIAKVCNVDSKKKNSAGKTCCYQPSILLYPRSDGFRGQETGRYRRRPDGTEKLNVPRRSLANNLQGLGIALVAAQKAEIPVILVDNAQASLDKGLKFADKLLEKDVAKSRITEEVAKATRERLRPTTQMEDLSDVDFVIEAVPEIPSLKEKIFAQLAEICPKHTILATNTSSISITKIAAATTKDATDTSTSSRVISTHFMNPVPVQKGVEIISGLQTSQSTVDAALDFVKKMGKVPSVSADSPGFLANRILMPYINEAIICLETGVGQKEDIDNIMKNGTNVPMGPLQLADFIGLDTCLAIMETLYQGLGDSKYRPSVLLRQYVDAGWLGKKSGRGFYNY
jgi:3-hydroxybutyryl-CoA dehydrogenase